MGRVLVTGAAGYLGGHCLAALRGAGHECLGLDLRPAQALSKGDFEIADLLDQRRLHHVLDAFAPEVVVHCAGQMDDGTIGSGALHRANIAASLALLEALRAQPGDAALVLASTGEVYAPAASVPLHEDAALAPEGRFGWSRLVVEHAVRDCASLFGLRFVILRAFELIGAFPELRATPAPQHKGALLWRVFDALNEGAPFPLIDAGAHTRDGTLERDVLFVGDAALAHVAACAHLLGGGENLECNIGRGRGASVREMLALVRRASGLAPNVRAGEEDRTQPPRRFSDVRRAASALNWRARTGLEDAVRSAHDHWRARQNSAPRAEPG